MRRGKRRDDDQPSANTADRCFLPTRTAEPLPSQLGCGSRLVTSQENDARNIEGGGGWYKGKTREREIQ